AIVHDYFLFTIVAAAVAGDEACVWAIGDGGYAVGDRVHALGPLADNQPSYLGYELLGRPQPAHTEAVDLRAGLRAGLCAVRAGTLVVATDGAVELGAGLYSGPGPGPGLAGFADPRLRAHPDGLRRRLTVLARGGERIDWDARRVVRTPAALQDDGAVAVLAWAP
ncbi:MAG TPA: hypothetical protein VH165_20470, partial [Kofleriaceae bacterium]|nr:hypothetical protein [Kofleriaceae bacterium]